MCLKFISIFCLKMAVKMNTVDLEIPRSPASATLYLSVGQSDVTGNEWTGTLSGPPGSSLLIGLPATK